MGLVDREGSRDRQVHLDPGEIWAAKVHKECKDHLDHVVSKAYKALKEYRVHQVEEPPTLAGEEPPAPLSRVLNWYMLAGQGGLHKNTKEELQTTSVFQIIPTTSHTRLESNATAL